MKGGGSFYQSLQYVNPLAGQGAFKLGGGTRRRKRSMYPKRGGFYPSLMGGVISNGPLLLTPAIAQATRLFRNEAERFTARHRKSRRATTKRSKRKGKNTRKA